MPPTRPFTRCFSLRWCGLLLASLLLSGKAEAQTQRPCPGHPSCYAATAYSMYTQTAAAAPTATPSSTRDFGTLQFMDLLSTPTPVGTAGVNLACPEKTFNPNGLDPAWSMVCSRCVEQVVGTKLRCLAVGLKFHQSRSRPSRLSQPITFAHAVQYADAHRYVPFDTDTFGRLLGYQVC